MIQMKLRIMQFLIISVFTAATLSWGAISYSEESEFNKAVNFVRDKDYTSAVNIFKGLAEQHDPDAQYNLALLLRKGLGHPSNYSLALQWAWLSQLSGKVRAAELSDELVSIVPDKAQELVRAKVLKILQDRMDNSDSDVILQKALFHLNIIIDPDYISAYALRSLGAAIGIKGAIKLRDEIETDLEPEDLMDAQARAAKLFSEFDWSMPVSQ